MSEGTQPKVSVILPCYNAHVFLGQALDSVRAQTFRDLEIVVIDDGSNNPETVAYLDGLPNDVRVVRQENRGLPAARNTGFRCARGEYVLPLDCDDWLDSTFLEKTLALLVASPEAAFAYSHLALEGEGQGVLAKSYNFLEQLFFNQMPYCLLLPRRLWEEVGGYDEGMRRGYEDWEFNIRLGAHGAFGVVCPEPLFHYRISSSGMLKSTSAHAHAELWGYIQSRHAGLYRPGALYRNWRRWGHLPSTYAPWLLFGWLLLYRMVPDSVCNLIMRRLRRFSHANRVGRAESARAEG